MERTCAYDVCTGCGACEAVCPRGCISFAEDGDLGHLYPKINEAVCIDCNRCRQVCPALIDNGLKAPTVAYGAVARDEAIYRTSTSGGAAMVLSELTLREGGVVYGCACTPGGGVEHVRVDRPEGLPALQGSKYVQSDMRKILRPLIEDVKAGRSVLFTGTPCQCAAVKALTGPHTPENLLTVDLVCHGVPSLRLLHRDLERHGVDVSLVRRISFRDGNKYSLKAQYDDGEGGLKTVYESNPMFEHKSEDLYYYAFIAGLTYRPTCYTCRFARPERCSDITIGDFHGYGTKPPTPSLTHHPHGISVVLPISEKGKSVCRELEERMIFCPRPLDEAIKSNSQLNAPWFPNGEVKLFLRLKSLTGIFAACQIAKSARETLELLRETTKNLKTLISRTIGR